MTLNDLSSGSKAIVLKIRGNNQLRLRLMELGLTPGTELVFQKKAPFGRAVQIRIRDYRLALGRSTAQLIEVKEL